MSAPYPDMLPFYLHSATSSGSGGGDEDPHRNPYRLKSSHEADVTGDQNPYREETENDQSAQAKWIMCKSPQGPCPVCQRSFKSSKALHGHMSCHPDQAWRGMVPPEQCDPHVRGAKMGAGSASGGEASGSGSIEWPFRCRDCGANFRTKQALGGHRASRKNKMRAGSASAAEASGGGGGIEWRFKCHNCGAKFRTGQALGGHKKGCNRLARDRLFVEQLLGGASVNNDNNSRDGSAQGSRILDLNLPPPEEEDE